MAYRELLDEADQAILDLLREDARRTVADIAERVHLSPAPVRRRIDRLERIGIIAGYTVVLDPDRMGPSMEAFTELRFAGNADAERILETAIRVPEVREAFATAGDPDALLRLRVDNTEELTRVVYGLRRIGKVTATKTLLVLDRRPRPGS